MLLLSLLAACSSYPADEDALDALRSDDLVTVTDDQQILFEPTADALDVGVLIYPGGLVAHEAYALPARALAEAGVPTIIVRMPSDLAVFAPKKAQRVQRQATDLADRWILAGHSLGGAMAATYAAKKPDTLAGLALWAAYPAASKDLSDTDLPTLSLTASEDGVLDWATWEARQDQLPPSTRFVEIEGGNHAGFAGYGPQDGDGERTISREAQQDALLDAMLDLVDEVQ